MVTIKKPHILTNSPSVEEDFAPAKRGGGGKKERND